MVDGDVGQAERHGRGAVASIAPATWFEAEDAVVARRVADDPPPSLACAIGVIPAATAAPAPPEDPPGERARSHGLWVGPNSLGSVVSIRPNAGVFVRPTVTRPAASIART